MKPSVFLFAMLVWICWGAYIPSLGLARSDGPWKPYIMIGVAYLIIACGGGALALIIKGDSFTFPPVVTQWGLIAGAVGALGALALTCAMVWGGAKMPHVVTAIVFPGVLAVSAILGWWQTRGDETVHTSPMLWVFIVLMIFCAAGIAYNTPHAPKKPPQSVDQLAQK